MQQNYTKNHITTCTSTMDAAWTLFEQGRFSEWSYVIAENQTEGRGQFRRTWHSAKGNLFASVRIGKTSGHILTPVFITASSAVNTLKSLGLMAEYKWPNDILVNRKKTGGILVENRSGVDIAGIGLNLSSSPPDEVLSSACTYHAAHLQEFDVFITPFEIWQKIHEAIMNTAMDKTEDHIESLEHTMAFINEQVVFTSPSGAEFPAVLKGLSKNGSIILKTADGEKTFLSGSFFPIVN